MQKWKATQAKVWSFFNGEDGVLHIVQTGHEDTFIVLFDSATAGAEPLNTMTKAQIEGSYDFVWDDKKGFIVKGE